MPRNGYNVVGEWVIFPDDATDWSSYAAKINANKQADAVFWLNCITFHVANMLKSLREIGYDKWVFAWSNAPGADVMKITGPDAAQKLVTQAFTPGSKDNPPELEALMKRSQAKYGANVPLYFETACPLGILVDMIQKAQSIDPTVVKKKWESMDGQTVNSLFGPAVISGTKTYKIKGHGLSHAHPNQILDKGVVTDAGWAEAGASSVKGALERGGERMRERVYRFYFGISSSRMDLTERRPSGTDESAPAPLGLMERHGGADCRNHSEHTRHVVDVHTRGAWASPSSST